MGITAVVPVREGSRRLKNKNVAPFAGTNLLINKLNQLKQLTPHIADAWRRRTKTGWSRIGRF